MDVTNEILERPSRHAGGDLAEAERDSEIASSSELLSRPMQTVDVAWLLWSKKQFIARFTLIGLIFFIVLVFVIPKRYTASARLMPPDYNTMSELAMSLPGLSSGSEDSGSGGGGGGGKSSGVMGLATQLLGLNSSGQLFVGVLQSRTIQMDLINTFDLMKVYGTRYPEDAQKILDSVTEVKVDDKTGILGIAVEDKNPQRAADMTARYIEDLNKVLEKVNNSSAHRERVFIEKRRAEVKIELDEAAKELSEFSSKNGVIDIPEQGKAFVAAAADLQAQLIAAQSMLTGLQQIYTDNNSRVREMKAQVDELQRQVNKMGGKDVTPANGSVLSSDELYPSVRQLPLIGVHYLDLFRRNKTDEAVYELLTKQYEIASLEEARDVPKAQVLDPPVIPQKKTSPHRTIIVLVGVFLSIGIACAYVIGKSHWERTDPQLPWKVFAREVASTCLAATWNSPRGLRIREAVGKWNNHDLSSSEGSGH